MHLKFHVCLVLLSVVPGIFAEDWESSVSPHQPGSFPEPKPVHMQYGFGWNNIVAATSDLHLTKPDGHYRLEGTGATTGAARSLWKFDGKQLAITDAKTLLPVEVRETEATKKKTFEMEVTYTPTSVTSKIQEQQGSDVKGKTRNFDFPNLMSLSSAMLYLRSQQLADGAVQRIVVYPSTSAYLCTVKVLGREHLTVPAGSYEAIKLDLQLTKIAKNRELRAHKKFKHATVWLSNDNDRLVLRIEAQVFIGTVFAELQSAQFDNARP